MGITGSVRLFGWFGDPDLAGTAAEFAEEFYTVAADAGLSVDSDEVDRDPGQFGAAGAYAIDHAEPDKFGVEAVALAAVTFVAAPLAGWAVEKVADAVWSRLGSAFERLRPAAASTRPSDRIVVLRTVYSEDQAVVEVTADLAEVSGEALVGYLALAQDRARFVAAGLPEGEVRIIQFVVGADGLSVPTVVTENRRM
ncbi:hypothetical protein [Nocardia bovistercoris]|uniref:Uncharacterized protein n=1 Tax=Nocardia bovistercoris TaxID=2785916 RepID=A0A931IIE0_9NOCA|nr:hypothetical protein [Nocardia bovistercoris]MBH0780916.1 hypothetical protein [Nocardia bovistercoris]